MAGDANGSAGGLAGNVGDAAFHRLCGVIRKQSGISLSERHRELVRTRLGGLMRKRQFRGYAALADAIEHDDELMRTVIDAVATNLTGFMREVAHFRQLGEVAKTISGRPPGTGKRSLRVWSAACSTGEEPYSAAIQVAESVPSLTGFDVRILATDISRNALSTARRGRYDEDRVAPLGQRRVALYFDPVAGAGRRGLTYSVKPQLRRLVTFARLNLMGDWPMSKGFDVIFCRNVMIYFDLPTRELLARRLARTLVPGGRLLVGHSETLPESGHGLVAVGGATYQRPPVGERDGQVA